jgi:hypothetical protein
MGPLAASLIKANTLKENFKKEVFSELTNGTT